MNEHIPFELPPDSSFRWPEPNEAIQVGWFLTARENHPTKPPVVLKQDELNLILGEGWCCINSPTSEQYAVNTDMNIVYYWTPLQNADFYYLAPKDQPIELVEIKQPEY